MTDQSDDRMMIANAIITNTRIKICFGGFAPEDAEYMARVLFSGYLDLQEWKEKSARPTAIGNKKELVRSSSRAQHEAEHNTIAYTTSHSHGEATGTMSSTSQSSGTFAADGSAQGLVMQAPAQLFGPNQAGAEAMPVPLTVSEGQSRSRGSSDMHSSSTGTSHITMDVHGEATTEGYGKSRGTSITEGVSETWVSEWATLPTQMYSLPEQQFKAVGELINLPQRYCFLKIGHGQPVRTRTLDVRPGFRSHFAKRAILPIFHANMLARSPYLRPAAEIDALIAARLSSILPSKPAPAFDTAPAPMPILDAPATFAADFLAKHAKPLPDPPKPKPKSRKPRPGRKPAGKLPPGVIERFRIVDGGKHDDGDKSPE